MRNGARRVHGVCSADGRAFVRKRSSSLSDGIESWTRRDGGGPRGPAGRSILVALAALLGTLEAIGVGGCHKTRTVAIEIRRGEYEPTLGYWPVTYGESGEIAYCAPLPDLTNADIASLHPELDLCHPGTVCVVAVLTEDGSGRLERLTRSHEGKPLLVLVDGEVVFVAKVKSVIRDRVCIVHGLTREEADALVRRF